MMKNPPSAYKETLVFVYPNAVVRVHIPDIDDEENERRMKLVRRAAEDLLRSL